MAEIMKISEERLAMIQKMTDDQFGKTEIIRGEDGCYKVADIESIINKIKELVASGQAPYLGEETE